MCINNLSTPKVRGRWKLLTSDLRMHATAHESLITQAHSEQKFLERMPSYVFTQIRLINSLEPPHWGEVGMMGV